MKFEVGDEIVVLHTNEEGKVVEIINDKMVMIEVRGVKFPSYIDQIDFPYFKRFTEKTRQKKKEKKFVDNIPKEKPKPAEARVSEGVWLSLLPKFIIDEFGDEVVELFKLHLVNKTGRGYKFIYRQLFFGETDFELNNEVTAFHDFYLHDISFPNFNDNPSFDFKFSLITPDKTKADFFETSLKIKPKQLFQRIEEMRQTNEPTINYKLFEVYPDKMIEEKPLLSVRAANEYAVYEAMSNFEILTMQLKEFEKWYDLAVAHHLPNFTVIHGVGSGKLRDEIHEILKTKKEVKYFINQYDHRFGYGATEIFFAP